MSAGLPAILRRHRTSTASYGCSGGPPMTTTQLFRAGLLRECWAFRGFILASVKREFVSRYLGTNLGFFWAVAQPSDIRW